MGKAIIVSSGGGGLYSVNEVLDNSWGSIMRIKLQNEISTLLITKASKAAIRANLQVAIAGLKAALSNAIVNETDTTDIVKSLAILNIDLVKANREINAIQTNINSNNFTIQGLSSTSEVLVSTIGWSADFKEDIPNGTVVGVVDRKRSDQLKNYITIQPTFRAGDTDGHLWDSDRDGVLQLKDGSPSAGWAFNYAMSDGADTWRPRYIYASIHIINHDNNSCEILVDDFFANSLAPHGKDASLPIGATFEYMSCDSFSFIVTDSVVVDVSDENNYIVIGFQTTPVECTNLPCEIYLRPFITNGQISASLGNALGFSVFGFCVDLPVGYTTPNFQSTLDEGGPTNGIGADFESTKYDDVTNNITNAYWDTFNFKVLKIYNWSTDINNKSFSPVVAYNKTDALNYNAPFIITKNSFLRMEFRAFGGIHSTTYAVFNGRLIVSEEELT